MKNERQQRREIARRDSKPGRRFALESPESKARRTVMQTTAYMTWESREQREVWAKMVFEGTLTIESLSKK